MEDSAALKFLIFLAIALVPFVMMACVHWHGLRGRAWQKVILFASVPYIVPACLLLTGAEPEIAGLVAGFLAPAPILGLIAGGIASGFNRTGKAAKVCVITTVAVSFLAPWSLIAFADNLYYQHSFERRLFAIRSAQGPVNVAVPIAYLHWGQRTVGFDGFLPTAYATSEGRISFLWLQLDQRTLRPWRQDIWSRAARAIEGRRPLRLGMAIGNRTPGFMPKVSNPGDTYESRRGLIVDRARANTEGWFTVCRDQISDFVGPVDASLTRCERWPTETDGPVLYMYTFEPIPGLDQANLDSAVTELLRSMGVPVRQ